LALTEDEWSALAISFRVGLCAVLGSLPAAVAVGYALARWSSSSSWPARAARPLLQLAVDLPLVLPPVVTGYLLLVLLVPRGPIGACLQSLFGIKLLFTWWAAAIASAVVSFPLMVRTIRVAFQNVDPRLEFAARGLGAGPVDAFFSVSLPLAARGVVSGAVLAFARSLGEFGATIMVLGSMEGRRTLPLAIYSLANRPGGLERCWRLVLISVALAGLALAVSEWFERRQSRRELA
jgi:molybdate transport system permease protein